MLPASLEQWGESFDRLTTAVEKRRADLWQQSKVTHFLCWAASSHWAHPQSQAGPWCPEIFLSSYHADAPNVLQPEANTPSCIWMSTDLQKHHLHKGSCFCVGRVMSAPLCSEPPASCVQDAWVQSNKLYPGLKVVLLQCQYPWCA